MHALLRHSLHPKWLSVFEGAFAKDPAKNTSNEVPFTTGSCQDFAPFTSGFPVEARQVKVSMNYGISGKCM